MSKHYITTDSPPQPRDDPWLELRNAIVKQAVNDYLCGMTKDTRTFFLSEWFQDLCSMDNTEIDGKTVLKVLDERREEMKRRRLAKHERNHHQV